MNAVNLPMNDLKGWIVIPNLTTLRAFYKRELGRERGNQEVNRLSVNGWRVVYDMRQEGVCSFVCERENPERTCSAVCWEPEFIGSVHPPRSPVS